MGQAFVVVDAFTDRPFAGNPAAVCVMEGPVDEAWMMSTSADLGHPDVEGPRPARWRLINAYVNRLLRVANRDPVVARTFLEVSGMVAPPQHMMRPRMAWRVLTGGRSPGRTSGNPGT